MGMVHASGWTESKRLTGGVWTLWPLEGSMWSPTPWAYSTHRMNAGWEGPPITPGVAMETNPSHNFWGDEEVGLVHSLTQQGGPLLSWGYFLLKQDRSQSYHASAPGF